MSNAQLTAINTQIGIMDKIRTISTDIANSRTQGYKATDLEFQKLVRGGEDEKEDELAFAFSPGTLIDFSPGAFEKTSEPLDCAIVDENGFFGVQTLQGQRYTRLGHFTINAEGTLVTITGDPVLDVGGGEINIPGEVQQPIIVSGDGTISGTVNGETQALARLGVFSFEDLKSLTKEGNSLFVTDEEAQVVENPKIVSGGLEGSNVNAIENMTALVDLHRSYTLLQKALEEHHNSKEMAISRLGKIGTAA